MASVINTNIASLNAQRNLTTSASSLATSLQRLSSGLRINSAKDDSAGMAISSRMTSQINGLNQAARNANDGISLAQTAEGSLNAISDNLQRMRELAVQASNASNSASDRTTLQNEVAQLASEIQRVSAGAQFNGVNLLDGSFNGQTFQVGANATVNDKITVTSIADTRTSALGSSYTASVTGGVTLAAGLAPGQLTLNGVSVGATTAGSLAGQTVGSAWAVAQAINASGSGVTAAANATTAVGAVQTTFVGITANTISINGVNVGAVSAGGAAPAQGANIATAINLISAATGVSAAAAADGKVTLTAADGRDILVVGSTVANDGLVASTTGTVTLSSTASTGFKVGGTAPANGGFTAATTAATLTGTSIANVSVASVAGAQTALASIDSALAAVDTSRAALGAFQNRFQSAVSNLMVTSENLTASRSRIQDADFAAETAAMTRGQILQQAGTAILAQANSLPNSVLSLLK